MNNDLISVIIPVYNVEEYISKCVESVLKQTYGNLEIILVDDGSTDFSGNICDEIGKRDCRVKVIHKENSGLSDARNLGLDVCTGKYILFVDGDDYIDYTMIEMLYQNINNSEADIAICGFYSVIDGIPKEAPVSRRYFCVEGTQKFDCIYNEFSMHTIVAWNKLYRREIFKEIRYRKGKFHEDEFIICELLNVANKLSYMLEPLYYYVQRYGSISRKFGFKKFDDMVEALEERLNFFESIGYRKGIIGTLKREYQHLGEMESQAELMKAFDETKTDVINNYCSKYIEIGKKLRAMEDRY